MEHEMKGKGKASSSSIIEYRKFHNKPGFRFAPSDTELLMHFLRRKVTGKVDRDPVIAEVDVYKYAPWDLPQLSALRNKERMWYFISPRHRRYQKGDKASRSTPLGSWRISSDAKMVRYNSRIVGTIKTLVFKIKGTERTYWVMHEYNLHDEKLAAKGVVQNFHVINKLFMKSGIGPRVRDDHGAPYLEEEWRSDDEDDNYFQHDFTEEGEQFSLLLRSFSQY